MIDDNRITGDKKKRSGVKNSKLLAGATLRLRRRYPVSNNLLYIVVLKNSGSSAMLDEMINVKNGKSTGTVMTRYHTQKVIRVIIAGRPEGQYIYCP